MSPVHNITLGQGGEEHEAADASLLDGVGRRFAGAVAIVTGGGSGIGRATVLRLGAEGAAVAVLDISGSAAEESAAQVVEGGGAATAFACDVTSEGDVTSTVAAIADALGRPSVVCNVAGIGGFFHTDQMPVERWEKILAVNLTGPFLVCRGAIPYLLDGGGSIVNVASNTGLMGQAYSAAYCASKAGLVMFTKSLAAEYVARGIRANVVAPGGVDTPLIGSFELPEGADARQLKRIMSPMGFATPSEIAASIAFLASRESSYTTGSVLSVDGGLTI